MKTKKADKTKSVTPHTIDPSADAPAAATIPETELTKVANLANRMIQINKAVEALDARKKELSDEKERIQGADLPGLMESFGLKEFTLKSGDKVFIKDIVAGSIPSESAIRSEKDPDKRIELKERFEMGMAYLEKNKAGALIKNFIVAELGKDSNKLANLALKALKDIGITEAEQSRGVHPASLNSWLKERIENGDPVDYDLFKIYTGTRAEIKKPSASKKGASLGKVRPVTS